MNRVQGRILDANFNRVLEGLRVIEDILRFSGNRTYKKLRNIRHEFSKIRNSLKLLKFRDINSDFYKENIPKRHLGLREVLIANFERVKQASRVIEEVLRITSPDISYKTQTLRFKIYDIEKKCL